MVVFSLSLIMCASVLVLLSVEVSLFTTHTTFVTAYPLHFPFQRMTFVSFNTDTSQPIGWPCLAPSSHGP